MTLSDPESRYNKSENCNIYFIISIYPKIFSALHNICIMQLRHTTENKLQYFVYSNLLNFQNKFFKEILNIFYSKYELSRRRVPRRNHQPKTRHQKPWFAVLEMQLLNLSENIKSQSMYNVHEASFYKKKNHLQTADHDCVTTGLNGVNPSHRNCSDIWHNVTPFLKSF